VIVPGGPSLFLARYPPRLAIQITASPMLGDVVGRFLFLFTFRIKKTTEIDVHVSKGRSIV